MRAIKILHVEDVDADYLQIDRVLKKSGLIFESICVSTKEAFTDALEEFRPDVILCDHSLPAFSSLNALKIMAEKKSRIPFILVTGTLSEDSLSELIKAGVYDYILKDRPLRLPSAITSALEKSDLERKKEEYFNSLLEQEKRFRALIENLSEAIVLVDQDEKVIYHSPSAARITGLSNEDAEGRSVFSFFHPDDIIVAKESFEHCGLIPRCTIGGSFRVRDKTGKFIWVEGSITNLLDDPSINGFIVNYRDVTENRKAQKLLEESEANFRSIFNNTEVSYVFLSRSFNVVSFNDPAVEMYKSIGDEPFEKGKNILNLLPPERKLVVTEKLERVLKGEKINYEKEYDKKGTSTWFNIWFLPVLNESKSDVLGIIVSAEDITSRKLIDLEREKMTSDLMIHIKNLEQFAYIVSHNLRSPVANIIGLSAMLQEMQSMSDSDKKRCLEGLAFSAEKLDDTIKDLNDILQIKRDINETRERIKLRGLFKEVLKSFEKVQGINDISIQSDFSAIDEIVSVRSYLYSILFNLISNGIKYRHRNRHCVIEVHTEFKGGETQLIYKDNGLGIDLSIHGDKIFGLYKRFHNHTEGKGVGLYMVKTQVEMLGGTISVSGKPNAGIEFRIAFPGS